MSEYAVVINYQLEGEPSKAIVLDTVDDVQINGRSTLTTMPLVNGDQISDHLEFVPFLHTQLSVAVRYLSAIPILIQTAPPIFL